MTRTLFVASSAAMALVVAACSQGSNTREGIWAAGSSTVFPFTTRVAENFGRNNPGGATPRVESLGTGGGIQAFCQGIGPSTPDVANASRQMKASEFDLCASNGVTDIIELKIGYDGLVIATARTGADFVLEGSDIFLALAKEVPGEGGFVANPHGRWDQVRPGLPAARIQVYGPPPTSGTRDSWVELGMAHSAEFMPQMAALKDSDSKKFEALSHTLREDGAWVDSGENDNAIVQTLTRTPGSVGVFGYSFLEQNISEVKPASVNGVFPTLEAIASGEYPISRSMFIYVKKAHIGVIPGLQEFLLEYLSDAAAGRGGYLQDRGIVPLPAAELAIERAKATNQTSMSRPPA
ncbi:substrate-binding domain-containing protein [Brevundimonas variabilis]|uniref:Phosphate transport system substrate-binding protein n=1 Tax=Brevundimonas variabilis TaxID=74312 RepID=A0A7W9CL14_9CAUL|nr:substrate-binding domain-containing protein [Brevundimonas variabilis]MBB5747152.1 phosphate transport system substrate-binding protein [Brevundimonas variabilis]